VRMGEERQVCVYDRGIVEMTARALPGPLAWMNVLIGRHEKRKEQHETSL